MLTTKVKDFTLRNKTNNDLPAGAEPAGLPLLLQQPATAQSSASSIHVISSQTTSLRYILQVD